MSKHSYTEIEFKNAPDHKTTPLNASNLNHIEAGITDAFTDIRAVEDALAPINITGSINNTGGTILSGTYFYKDGVLVKALNDIANGATLTVGTNYTVVVGGVLNNWAGQNVQVYSYSDSEITEMSAKYYDATNSLKVSFVWQPAVARDNGFIEMTLAVGNTNISKIVQIYSYETGDVYFLRYVNGSLLVDGRTIPALQHMVVQFEIDGINAR